MFGRSYRECELELKVERLERELDKLRVEDRKEQNKLRVDARVDYLEGKVSAYEHAISNGGMSQWKS